MIRPVRRLLPLLALAAQLGPGPARAWNDEGHELVGALAERRLGPEASALVRELLGDGHLSDHEVAVWADDHRTRANAPNHWVDIPFEAGRYDAARDCPGGLCAVACIERAAEVLARDDDPGRRLEALRWLVHVVGDLHQPLHAAQGWRQGNLGGVRLPARAGSPPFDTNLHVVWDAVVVWPILAGRSPTEAAAALDAALDEANDEDPARLIWAGRSLPKARLQGERATYWLGRLEPDAGPALRLAARAHHLRPPYHGQPHPGPQDCRRDTGREDRGRAPAQCHCHRRQCGAWD